MNKLNTSKRKGQNSQKSIVSTIKNWITPEAIKQVKRNQAKVKQSEGVKELKK